VLIASQIEAIKSSLLSALRNALTDEQKEATIAPAVQSAITLYGGGQSSAITSVIMQTAEGASVPICSIGKGLAVASANVAATNLTAANAIAATVANEAGSELRSCYQQASIERGFSNLAAIAAQDPTVTGGTGGQGGIGAGGLGGGATGGGTAGGGGGGCLNPSCTKL
jgi:uncharacterized membrane protein YgcG